MHVELDQLGGEEGALNHGIPQLYEEIRDVETETAAETAGTSRVAAPVPEYEEVVLAGEISRSTDPYQITQCSAYGVSLN